MGRDQPESPYIVLSSPGPSVLEMNWFLKVSLPWRAEKGIGAHPYIGSHASVLFLESTMALRPTYLLHTLSWQCEMTSSSSSSSYIPLYSMVLSSAWQCSQPLPAAIPYTFLSLLLTICILHGLFITHVCHTHYARLLY